ncbi:hypothetical protein ACFU8W_47125 [Streptomyces sp. NPDC057565]|uniref:hypothetical protein n=1 Tax=Streptomyces sp. NPDC057565 TaxID=3346169 RepID=UPI00368DB4AD
MTTASTLIAVPLLSTARAAVETDRQVRRLYAVAYTVSRIGRLLTNPNATADRVTYATTRIARAVAAARRLLAVPGVADHEETREAMGRIEAAERRLTAPETRLLVIANAAREAADEAADDRCLLLYRDIEQRSRYLVRASNRGRWNRHEYDACTALQHQATQYRLISTAEHAARQDEPGLPSLPAYIERKAAARATIRARCAPGIRCERSPCLTYGAVWVEYGGARWFLCESCIPAENADLLARGFDPGIRLVPGGLPTRARFSVRLYNGTGKGGKTVDCDNAQEAQFVAETERPFNNTGYQIQVRHESRPTVRPSAGT